MLKEEKEKEEKEQKEEAEAQEEANTLLLRTPVNRQMTCLRS